MFNTTPFSFIRFIIMKSSTNKATYIHLGHDIAYWTLNINIIYEQLLFYAAYVGLILND